MPLQSVAAMGPQMASMAIDIPVNADCEDLGDQNDSNREKVVDSLKDKQSGSGLNKMEQTTLDKAESTGMTFSSISSQIPGAEGVSCATSSGCAQTHSPDTLSEGGSSAMKQGANKDTRKAMEDGDPKHDALKEQAGVLCDDYVHPGGGKGAHAEPKIINELSAGGSAMRGGSLLLNIDWRFKRDGKAQQSGMPCSACYDMLCHAATKCDIKIYICDHKGDATELSPTKDCADDENGYTNLCKRVDGKSIPGR